MKAISFTGTLVVPLVILIGCGAGYKDGDIGYESSEKLSQKIDVEAYLFDAKLRRDGKPTSVRLEFYHTDSAIAIAGRGYLGKGALRGRLTADSMEVYFPATEEYLYEPVADVLGSADCSQPLPRISLLKLFNNLPDSVLLSSELVVDSDYDDARHPVFRIRSPHCLWEIKVTYAFQKKGWRIKEFTFDDGQGTTLSGKRRTYKREASVKAGKFMVPRKPGSIRITL